MAPLAISAATIDGILDRHRTAVIGGRRIAGDRDRQRVAEILVGDADGAVLPAECSAPSCRRRLREWRTGLVAPSMTGTSLLRAGDGDHQVLGADIAVPVIDLGDDR